MKRRLSSPLSLPGLRLALTLALLGMLAWRLDTGQLLDRLATLSPGWALLAVAIGVPQVVLSAWRWRMTSQQIGIPLGWATAIREYYLATFLNQVLPGGVMGDAARAWRQGQPRTSQEQHRTLQEQHQTLEEKSRRGQAVRAVIIERASGQIVLLGVALVAIVASSALRDGIAELWRALIDRISAVDIFAAWSPFLGPASIVALIASLVFAAAALTRLAVGSLLAPFWRDLRRALLSVKVWPAQLLGSLLVVATYITVFLCAAQALGIGRPISVLLPLIPPLLMAMAIPLTVAGWGLREGAAALIWPLAGLPAQEGVALSITYGMLILAANLPGLVILLLDHRSAARSDAAQPIEPARVEPAPDEAASGGHSG